MKERLMWEDEYDDTYSNTYKSTVLDIRGNAIVIQRKERQRCGFITDRREKPSKEREV